MFDLTALSIFAIALALSAGSPGPSIAALVSRVVSNGWRDVLPFVVAMWIGEVIWLTCAVLGLAAIAEQFQFIFLLIKYVGIAYLLFLAWGMWRTPAGGQFDHQALPPRTSNRTKMFFAGIAVTLGNPKIMVFYMALLPTLLDLGSTTIAQWLILATLTATILAFVDLSYMALAWRARKLLRSPRTVRMANRLSALSLGGAAAFIAAKP